MVVAQTVLNSSSINTGHAEVQPLPTVILNVDHLTAGYTSEPAIQDVSFAVHQGERIALVGPNGAGKSTLMKALIGLLNPSTGQVAIHGNMSRDAVRHIAYVPQFGEVDWNFPVTVWDVVMMGRVRHIGWFRIPLPRSTHYAAVSNALKRVGLENYAHRQIGALSGGEKRRVFVARALAQEADILLLDEPFAGVDVRAQEIMFDVLETLQREGVTIILATHDLTLASTRFDRMMLINCELIAFGKSHEVFQPDLLARAYGGQLAVWQHGEQVIVVADQHK